ncbi:MAG TPA: hypothetical protein VGX75_06450 [bacterium]|nr:hypothetical protein [bacterium]
MHSSGYRNYNNPVVPSDLRVVMMPAAAALALGYGVAAAVVGGTRSWRPWPLVAFAAGGIAFPLTVFLTSSIQVLLASVLGWGPDAIAMTLGPGIAGAVVTAVVNEVFTLAAALIVWRWSRGGTLLGFGAAAGAGFAVVGAYEIIHLALIARALPISSASSFAVSLVQQLAFVAANSASTALAAFGALGRRAGFYLGAAVLFQVLFLVFGLLFELRVYSNMVWTVLDVAAAVALVAGVLILGRRRPASAALAPAA